MRIWPDGTPSRLCREVHPSRTAVVCCTGPATALSAPNCPGGPWGSWVEVGAAMGVRGLLNSLVVPVCVQTAFLL